MNNIKELKIKLIYKMKNYYEKEDSKILKLKILHRWANKVKLIQLREKDKEKFRIIIANTLRNIYKMNLNYALHKWKKKVQKIREKYFISLLAQ